ncbi:MAG: glycosyltransferase family 9 protein [Prevotella sp.]|nr:glycosyltransferase family 9 protein [Prevotella sp.]
MAEATLIARKHFWKHYLKKHDVPFHVELNTPTRILIVRFRQMGDAILSTPVCNTLRKNFPHAVIDFVLNERIAPLFEGHPSIDNIITFDERERHSTLTYLRKIWHVVHQHHYDVIIDMRSTVNTLPFALFSPSTDYRIGLCKSYTRFVYNYKIEPCQRGESMVSHNLQLLSPLQVETDRHISLCISKEEISKFQAYMEQEGIDFSRPIMLAGVTAKLNNKTWKMEWMTETLHRFMQTYPNVQIIFNYAPGKEEENAREIYVDLHQDKRIFIDIQAQSARQLAAMASLCTFYFGNEGGARHIVQAMQRPSFAICSPIADKQTWISQDSNILSEAVAPSDITDEIHGKSYEELYDLLTVDIVWKRLQTFCQQLSI